jgi:DNA-directed RNA polymerase specialized sigma24 family protein
VWYNRGMSKLLSQIPREHIEAIRQLGGEGLPIERIAFLTHMSESTVREVLAAPVNTTKESPADLGEAARKPVNNDETRRP